MPSLLNCNRVLKCEVIKIIFLKLWDLSDILKEQRPKTSILSTPKKFRRVLELSENNWAKISEKNCLEMLIFGK